MRWVPEHPASLGSSKPSLKLLGNVAESAVASLLTIPEQKFPNVLEILSLCLPPPVL